MPTEPGGSPTPEPAHPEARWEAFVGFFVDNKLVVLIATALLVLSGLAQNQTPGTIDWPR